MTVVILCLEEVKFTKVPPARVSVNAGESVRLEWEYSITGGTREEAFSQYSPTWSLYDDKGTGVQLAAEDKNSQWAWSVSPTCPASLKSRLIKPPGQFKAHLVISNVQTSDAGIYGCTLHFAGGDNFITEKTELVVQSKHE